MKFFSLLFLSSFSLFASAGSIVLENAKNPESIGYDAGQDKLYVSSYGDGAIYQINRATSRVKLYQAAGFEGRTTVVGVKVDFLRRHLWVVDGKGVSIYDLKKDVVDVTQSDEDTGYRLARLERSDVVEVAAPAESFLNDIAIDGEGNGYITDSKFPRIYKVTLSKSAPDGPKTFKMTVLKDLTEKIPFGEVNGNSFNLNGIVLSPNENSLIVAKTNDGALYRIWLSTNRVEEIKLVNENGETTRLLNADGLAWAKDDVLYVIQNFKNKVTRIKFKESQDPLVAEDFPLEGLKTPTGAAVFKKNVHGEIVSQELFITNSQFTPTDPVTPFDVLKVSLDNE